MKLEQFAETLGFETYPDELNTIWDSLPADNAPACELDYIDKLQADYDTFGGYYPLVRETAIEINSDPLCSAWVKTAIAYAKDKNAKETSLLPTPKMDGSALRDLLPLYILIGLAPAGIAELRQRGFSSLPTTKYRLAPP